MDKDPALQAAASRIRAARAFADLSQQALADHLGKSTATLKRIERGLREASTDELWAIADRCGVPRHFMEKGFDDASNGNGEADPLRDLRNRVDRIEQRQDAELEDLRQRLVERVRAANEPAGSQSESPESRPRGRAKRQR